jgi:hypothetical protein
MTFFEGVLEALGLAHSGPVAVGVFPSAYPDPFAADTKLQAALDQAIAGAVTRRGQPAASFPIPFTIAEVTSGTPPFPMAGHLDSEVDYIASEAKVAVMYAAFELRAMVRRFAAANPKIALAQVLSQVAAVQDGLFLRAVPQLNAAKNITDVNRRPSYSQVFTASGGGTIDFATGYATAMHEMIVPSSDSDAETCVHGVGYSYLNGTLSAGGFITSGPAPAGIWVAGDYSFGTGWPYVRGVTSVNDGPAAYAGTTRQMARMLALISTGTLVDAATSGEMAALLGEAAHGTGGNPPPDPPWTSRDTPAIPVANFVLNKIGLGPKGRDHLGSPQFYSEVSLVKDAAAAGHSYVIAWQNLLDTGPYSPTSDMAQVILDTLGAYE